MAAMLLPNVAPVPPPHPRPREMTSRGGSASNRTLACLFGDGWDRDITYRADTRRRGGSAAKGGAGAGGVGGSQPGGGGGGGGTRYERDLERELVKEVLASERWLDDPNSFLSCVVRASSALLHVAAAPSRRRQRPQSSETSGGGGGGGGDSAPVAAAATAPPIVVPKKFWVYSETPLCQSLSADAITEAAFDHQSKLWRKRIFPSDKPAGRVDVVFLAHTLDRMLSAVDVSVISRPDECYSPESTSFNDTFERLLAVYNIGFAEVTRHVYCACVERGVLLDRIRALYVDLASNCLDMVGYLKRKLVSAADAQARSAEALQKAAQEAATATYERRARDAEARGLQAEVDALQRRLKDQARMDTREELMRQFLDNQAERNARILELQATQWAGGGGRGQGSGSLIPLTGPAVSSPSLAGQPQQSNTSLAEVGGGRSDAGSPTQGGGGGGRRSSTFCDSGDLSASPPRGLSTMSVGLLPGPPPPPPVEVRERGTQTHSDRWDRPLFTALCAFCNEMKETSVAAEEVTPLYASILFQSPLESVQWAGSKVAEVCSDAEKEVRAQQAAQEDGKADAATGVGGEQPGKTAGITITKKMLVEALDESVACLREINTRLTAHAQGQKSAAAAAGGAAASSRSKSSVAGGSEKPGFKSADDVRAAQPAALSEEHLAKTFSLKPPSANEVCSLCMRPPPPPKALPPPLPPPPPQKAETRAAGCQCDPPQAAPAEPPPESAAHKELAQRASGLEAKVEACQAELKASSDAAAKLAADWEQRVRDAEVRAEALEADVRQTAESLREAEERVAECERQREEQQAQMRQQQQQHLQLQQGLLARSAVLSTTTSSTGDCAPFGASLSVAPAGGASASSAAAASCSAAEPWLVELAGVVEESGVAEDSPLPSPRSNDGSRRARASILARSQSQSKSESGLRLGSPLQQQQPQQQQQKEESIEDEGVMLVRGLTMSFRGVPRVDSPVSPVRQGSQSPVLAAKHPPVMLEVEPCASVNLPSTPATASLNLSNTGFAVAIAGALATPTHQQLQPPEPSSPEAIALTGQTSFTRAMVERESSSSFLHRNPSDVSAHSGDGEAAVATPLRKDKEPRTPTKGVTHRLTKRTTTQEKDACRHKRRERAASQRSAVMTHVVAGSYAPKTLLWVLKQISALYKAKMASDTAADVTLAEFLVDHMRQKHGSSKMSGEQVGVLLATVRAHSGTDARVDIFSRFLSARYPPQALAAALRYTKALEEARIGPDFGKGLADEALEQARVSLLRCLFVLGQLETCEETVAAVTERLRACAEPMPEARYKEGMLKTGYAAGDVGKLEKQWGCDPQTARAAILRTDFVRAVVECLPEAQVPAGLPVLTSPLSPSLAADTLPVVARPPLPPPLELQPPGTAVSLPLVETQLVESPVEFVQVGEEAQSGGGEEDKEEAPGVAAEGCGDGKEEDEEDGEGKVPTLEEEA